MKSVSSFQQTMTAFGSQVINRAAQQSLRGGETPLTAAPTGCTTATPAPAPASGGNTNCGCTTTLMPAAPTFIRI
jgi:hypothetical protein